jgi:hypothetical protein
MTNPWSPGIHSTSSSGTGAPEDGAGGTEMSFEVVANIQFATPADFLRQALASGFIPESERPRIEYLLSRLPEPAPPEPRPEPSNTGIRTIYGEI